MESMENNDLFDKLKGIQLPSLPIVVREVQKLINNPDSTLDQIAQVIEKDQAIASKTLRLVNSAYYALKEKISSITEAINFLGLKTVNNMLLNLSVMKIFKEANLTSFFNPALFWVHSVGCGLLSKKMAVEIKHDDTELCFTAGLIHDIGRLIFYQFFTKEFFTAIKQSIDGDIALSLKEKEIFGFNHCDLGYHLAKKWDLPDNLAYPIKFHNDISNIPQDLDPHRKTIMIIAKANQLCNKYDIGKSYENHSISDRQFQEPEYQERQIEEKITEVNQEIKTLLHELGV